MKPDHIIQPSPKQKQERIDRLTVELSGLGYTVVNSDWLRAIVDQQKRKTLALEDFR